MKFAFVISTATALALGYTAGFTTDNLTAKAQVPIKLEKRICKELGAGAVTAYELFVDEKYCPEVDDVFGLDPDTCTHEMTKGDEVCVKWEPVPQKYYTCSHIALDGNFSVGEPQ